MTSELEQLLGLAEDEPTPRHPSDRHVNRERCTSTCCECSAPIKWWHYPDRKRLRIIRCHKCTAKLWTDKLQAMQNASGATKH